MAAGASVTVRWGEEDAVLTVQDVLDEDGSVAAFAAMLVEDDVPFASWWIVGCMLYTAGHYVAVKELFGQASSAYAARICRRAQPTPPPGAAAAAVLAAKRPGEEDQRLLRHMVLGRGCATLAAGLALPRQALVEKAPALSMAAQADLRATAAVAGGDKWGDAMQQASRGVTQLFQAMTASIQELAVGAAGAGLNNPTDFLRQAARDFNNAQARFRAAFPNGSPTAALLGGGVVALALEEPSDAFTLFRQALVENPEGSGAAARLGLGHALWALGHKEAAERAFAEALSVDRTSVPAMSALATLYLVRAQEGRTLGGAGDPLVEAQRLLAEARELDPHDAHVLNQLSRIAFMQWQPVTSAADGSPLTASAPAYGAEVTLSTAPLQPLRAGEVLRLHAPGGGLTTLVRLHAKAATVPGQPLRLRLAEQVGSRAVVGARVERRALDTALSYAEEAKDKTTSPAVKAETYSLLGRAAHAMGDTLRALAAYKEAVSRQPEGVPAGSTGSVLGWLGRARLQLREDDKNASKFVLEQLEERDRSNTDVLKLLGYMNLLKADGFAEQLRTPGMVEAAAAPQLAATAAQSRAKAKRRLTEAVELAPKDYEAWLLLARAAQGGEDRASVEAAERAYRRAAQVLVHSNRVLPPTLCNNWAVLHMRRGAWDKAETALATGLKPLLHRLAPPGRDAQDPALASAVLHSPAGITLAFNWAVLKEGRGDRAGAIAALRDILSAMPTYVDAALRLARLYRDDGQAVVAGQWLRRAIVMTTLKVPWQEVADAVPTTDVPRVVPAGQAGALPGAPPLADLALPLTRLSTARAAALCLLGCLAQDEGDLDGAAQWYGQVRGVNYGTATSRMAAAFDPYVAVAEQNLALARVLTTDLEECHAAGAGVVQYQHLTTMQRAGRERELGDLSTAFLHTMKLHPGSLFAANGWGCVLAERGSLAEARRVFSAVREASMDIGCVAVNLGHVEAALGKHATAVKLFSHALLKFYGGIDMDVELARQEEAERAAGPAVALPTALPSVEDAVAAVAAGRAMVMTNVPPSLLEAAVTDTRALTRVSTRATQHTLMALALAFYRDNRRMQCVRTTRFALALSPLDLRLWFNLAFSTGEAAFKELGEQEALEHKSVAAVRGAQVQLGKCLEVLRWLVAVLEELTARAKASWFSDMGKDPAAPLDDEETAGLAAFVEAQVAVSRVGVARSVVEHLLGVAAQAAANAEGLAALAEQSVEQQEAQAALREAALAERQAAKARASEAEAAEATRKRMLAQEQAALLMGTLDKRRAEWQAAEDAATTAAANRKKVGKGAAAARARARAGLGEVSWRAPAFDAMPNYTSDDEALLLQRGVTGGTAAADALTADISALFDGDAEAAAAVLGAAPGDAAPAVSLDAMFLFDGFDVRQLAGGQMLAAGAGVGTGDLSLAALGLAPEDGEAAAMADLFGEPDAAPPALAATQLDTQAEETQLDTQAAETQLDTQAEEAVAPVGGRKRRAVVESDEDSDVELPAASGAGEPPAPSPGKKARVEE